MPDERDTPRAPTRPQPATTLADGVSIETGYIPGALPSPRAALVAEDRRVFGRTAPAHLDVLRAACQRPPDEEPLRLFYDGADLSDAPEWAGLRVEIFAFQLTATVSANGGESLRVPAGHPWVYWEFPGIDGPCIVARWCHRYPGRPGVLEVGWDARHWFATPVRRSVHFLGAGTAEDATRLLALWRTGNEGSAAKRARTESTRRRDREFDLAQAVEAATALMRGGHQPLEDEVHDAVASADGFTTDAIRSRWRRADPPITIGEVRALVKKRAPLLHLPPTDETP